MMPAEAITPTHQSSAPPAAGTTVGGVRAALSAPSVASLPGRAVLALANTPAWHGRPVRWRLQLAARAVWAGLLARWHAARAFDLRLAFAGWQGQADGTATVVVDGLWLKYAHGRLWLLVACPAGHPAPHEAAVPSLPALAELIVASQATPDLPPWGCPPACPGTDPAVLAAAGHPRLRPVPADPDPDRDPDSEPGAGLAGVD